MYNDMNQNQYPNQGQFQNQYQYQYPQQPPESPGFGVASMVLGIISLCLSCCAYFISIPSIKRINLSFFIEYIQIAKNSIL